MNQTISLKVFIGCDIEVQMQDLKKYVAPDASRNEILLGLQELIIKELEKEQNDKVRTPGPTIFRTFDTYNELFHFNDLENPEDGVRAELDKVHPLLNSELKRYYESDAMIEIEDPDDPDLQKLWIEV